MNGDTYCKCLCGPVCLPSSAALSTSQFFLRGVKEFGDDLVVECLLCEHEHMSSAHHTRIQAQLQLGQRDR